MANALTKNESALIAVDTEFSGDNPFGGYALLALGAASVDKPEETFYAELKPLTEGRIVTINTEAMKVAALGLSCVTKTKMPGCDPTKNDFNPIEVIAYLKQHGQELTEVTDAFTAWTNKVAEDRIPVLLSDTSGPDWMWIQYLLHFATGKKPFYFNGWDVTSAWRGRSNSFTQKFDGPEAMKKLGFTDTRNPAHNALQDALHIAKMAKLLIENMRA